MNLSDLQAEAGRLLADANNERWSAAILLTRINLAQADIQGQTNAIKTSESLNLVSGTSAYAVASDAIDILKVVITDNQGNATPLKGYTTIDLDFYWPTWRQFSNGTPFGYYWDGVANTVNLVPAPDWTLTSGLTVIESQLPTDLVNSTDIPFDSDTQMVPYHMSIVHWVVAQCWLDDGTPEALAKSKFHRTNDMDHPGEYEKWIKKINSQFDVAEDVPTQIKFKPQGGRIGSWGVSKSNPFANF